MASARKVNKLLQAAARARLEGWTGVKTYYNKGYVRGFPPGSNERFLKRYYSIGK